MGKAVLNNTPRSFTSGSGAVIGAAGAVFAIDIIIIAEDGKLL